MAKDSDSKHHKLSANYRLLLVVTKEDWEQSIDGDPYHDGKWIHVRDEAKDLDLMRFTNGDALVDSETEQLISTDEIRKKYHLYDVELVECCLSPNYVEGFDNYELWEMAMGEGYIDEEEVSWAVLNAWIKDGKYWCGENGGYIEQRELSPEIAASLKDALEEEEEEEEYISKSEQQKEVKNKDEEDTVIVYSSKQEMFDACLEEGDLTEILSNADEWMFYIGKNIEALAEFFSEENPYAITGSEPEWMLKLFKDNGVVTC